MPTCEEILGLPPEGWKAIGEMDDNQLDIYLKDVTILEPVIPLDTSEPNRVIKEKKNKEDSDNNTEVDDNPFKAKVKKSKGRPKLTTEDMDAAMDNLLADL